VTTSKRLKIGTAVAAALALTISLTACGTTEKSNTPTSSGSAGGSAAGIDASACPDSATKEITGDTITIGQSGPLSGPYAAVGSANKTVKAYVDSINADGGLQTTAGKKKLKLITLDDQYQASKTQSNVRELVEQDHVSAIVGLVGTANGLAVAPYLDQQCVPSLFPLSGSTQLLQYKFTTVGQTYLDQGAVIGKYLKQKYPNAKVAVLYQNDDTGKDSLAGVKSQIDGTGISIVKEESYEPTDTDVSAQMTTLAATKADVLLGFAFSVKCTQALKNLQATSWRPVILTDTMCADNDINAANVPDIATKIYKTDANKTSQALYGSDADFKKFVATVTKEGIEPTATPVTAWVPFELDLAAISNAKPLSSVGIAEAARSLPADTHPGLLRDGIQISTTPGEPAIRQFYMDPWDPAAKGFGKSTEPPISAE